MKASFCEVEHKKSTKMRKLRHFSKVKERSFETFHVEKRGWNKKYSPIAK